MHRSLSKSIVPNLHFFNTANAMPLIQFLLDSDTEAMYHIPIQ